MAYIGGAGGGGPSLYMSIYAKDRTGEAFERVTSKMNKLSSVAISTMHRVGSLSMSFATLGRVTGMLNDEQARAIGVFGLVINVIATVATVTKALTSITWAQVAAETWKVSLMTLGVGVAIAAAAAVAVLSMQTQKAADSQKSYNTELEKGINIQKRRAASQNLVRRGQYEEFVD